MAASSQDLRVAFITPSYARGWRFQSLLKEFSKLFPKTVVFTGIWPGFTPGYEGTFQVRLLRGVKIFNLRKTERGSGRRFVWVSPSALWQLLRSRPKVIFVNGFHLCAAYALLVKALFGSRVILFWQGVSPETGGAKGSVRLRVRRSMARFFDLAICNTRAGTRYLEDFVGIPSAKLWHRNCEVAEQSAFCSPGEDEGALAGVRRPMFLFVGRLIRGKGLHNLLRACSLLRQRGLNDFSLVLAGDGDEKEELQRYAAALGLKDHVRWVGFVPYQNLGAYYEACDVFVLPSLEDTWGIVVPEAMLFGKPILCSQQAGAHEIVREGVNGFVFDARNPEALAANMARFICEPDLIATFGSASKEISQQYTPEGTAKILESAVFKVLELGERDPVADRVYERR